MFGQLENLLQTEYVPSFAPAKSTKKFNFKKDPSPSNPPSPTVSNQSKNQFMSQKNEKTQQPQSFSPRRTSMFILHKAQSNQNKSESFKDIKNKPKKDEWEIALPEIPNYSFAKQIDEENKQQTQNQQYVPRGMRPPLSQKSSERSFQQQTRPLKNSQFSKPKFQTQNNFASVKNANPQNFKLYQQQIKGLKKQLQEQRSDYEKRIQENSKRWKDQKQSLIQLHQQQLNVKLQLKDIQIKRLKQLHQIEIKSKNNQQNSNTNIAKLVSKLQEKAQALQRINSNFSSHKPLDPNLENKLSRQLAQINEKKQQLKEKQSQFEKYQNQTRKEISQEKKSLLNQYKRLQELQDNLLAKQRKIQIQLSSSQSKLHKQSQEIKRQYDEKLKGLQLQRQTINHQKQLTKQLQSTYQLKHKQLLEQSHERLRELNYQKLKVQQKSIDYERMLKEMSMKNDEVQHLREQLKNKISVVDLQRKRLRTDSESMTQTMPNQKFNKTGFSFPIERTIEVQCSLPQYPDSSFKKSLTDLKNQYLKSMQNMRFH